MRDTTGVATTTTMSSTVGITFAVWVWAGWALYQGPVRTRVVTAVTVIAPVIMIALLAFNILAVPGALEGLTKFFSTYNFDILLRWDTWTAVTGSMFYSLNISTGSIAAVASLSPSYRFNSFYTTYESS
eukprot:GHVQ01042073.1.p1 GENE.GHVQ01042073.1~~GHVQ01042073.1.p1  ORF type:complete len:129 (+),score=7.47 GHVQ01042073.1:529-915(+)